MRTDSSPLGLRGPAARARRRRAVLVAAQDVFVAHGYHGARMDEISARSGISKPVLYDHFAGKLDLYLAVLQHNLDRMVDGVRAAVARDTDPRHRVRRAVQSYFDFVEHDVGGYVLVFESPVPSEPSVEWRVRTAMRDCAALVSVELRAGGVDEARAEIQAWALVGISRLTAGHWLEAGRPISKSDAVDTAAALCWNGLSTVARQQEEQGQSWPRLSH
ncbi:TetR/AcrR family transcriptional regulator [Nocardia fluminea]|uniref:TetR/AcrR family transcriptional regulator n=1 Tax=Nocardia fluminea TaxID=134984 RepID=UPI00366EB355